MKKEEPDRSTFRKKLLVEGNDDFHVVAHIRNNHGLVDNFDIVDCRSVDKVKKNLRAHLLAKDTDVIGIIVDADGDTEHADDALKARWDSLIGELSKYGYAVPNAPDNSGTVIRGFAHFPKIGIWLMPDNVQRPGMLEDFMATLITPHDALKPIAERTLDEIETIRFSEESRRWFKSIHRSKALIHTWLAWQDEPGRPMGVAIKAKMFDSDTELCKRFAKWLGDLFA